MRSQQSIILLITLLFGGFFISTLSATAVVPDSLEARTNIRRLDSNHTPNDDVLRVIVTPETQSIPFGGVATFTVVVLNVSDNVNLVNVTVSSPLAADCNRNIGNLAADSNFPPYQCSSMNVMAPFTNNVHVEGTNPINNQVSSDDDNAQVEIIALDVVLDASPDTLAEPGGLVDFSLVITDTGSINVSLQSLDSPQYGDLTNINNENVSDNSCALDTNPPLLNADGDAFSCSFSAQVTGQPDDYNIVVTAVAVDENDFSISESSTAMVRLSDVEANLDFTLSALPTTIFAPGSSVIFELQLNNTSLVDSIIIGHLKDNIHEDLNGFGDCQTPQLIPAGEIYTCSYSEEVTGEPESEHIRIVTVSGTDDDIPNNPIERSDEVSISIVEKPEYIRFLPLIIDTIDEPNNRCENAYPLDTNQTYYFYANDQDDWYTFDLEEQGNVTVSLTNFIPVTGQIQVYKKNNCENFVPEDLIGFNGNHDTTKQVPLGTQAPGHYLIWIINDGTITSPEPYKLIVTVQ